MQRSKLLRRSCIVGAAAAIVPAASLSLAQTRNWIGATNSDWSTASNWDTGVPNSSTSATFTGGTSQNQSVIINSPNSACFFLTDSGIQQIHAGSYPLAVGGDLNIYPQPGAGPANLTLQSGTVSAAGNTNVGGTSSGSVGAGYLEIDSGATLNVSGTTTLYGSGSLNLAGGTLSTGTLSDGGNASLLTWGVGTLNLASTSNEIHLDSSGPLGGVISLGAGKNLVTNFTTYVGYSAPATMNISNGGTFVTDTNGGSAIVTNLSSASGSTVTIDGAGSSWTITGTGDTRIGAYGTGTLTVQNGGNFSSQTYVDIGSSNNPSYGLGNGTVNVAGAASSFSTASNLIIGGLGTGFFNLFSGDVTVAGKTTIGNTPSYLGISGGTFTTGTLSGSSVSWVGGTLHVTDGGFTFNAGPFVASEVLTLSEGRSSQQTGVPTEIDGLGQVAGVVLSEGSQSGTAWYYLPGKAINPIGLYDASHTITRDAQKIWDNKLLEMNSAGEVLGDVPDTNGAITNGQDAWVATWNGTLLIGLTGPANTSSYGVRYNVPVALNALGDAIGWSQNFSTGGDDAWLWSGQGTQIIGLTDAAHTSYGYSVNRPAALNDAGQVVGWADSFNGNGGTDAWLYSPTSQSTQIIGLTDATHTRPGGGPVNYPVAINPSGMVIGYATRFTGGGQDAWLYSPLSTSTQTIGLFDAAHLSASGYPTNQPEIISSGGWIVGTAERFTNGTDDYTSDPWLYSPLTQATKIIGLYDSLHASPPGHTGNSVQFINASGLVVGEAERYLGGVDQNQSDLWAYDPAKNATYTLPFAEYNDTAYNWLSLSDTGVGIGTFFNSQTSAEDLFTWTEGNGVVDLGSVASVTGGGASPVVANMTNGGALNIAAAGAYVASRAASVTSVNSGMNLILAGDATIGNGATLVLSGGTITAPAIVVQYGGRFQLSSGSISSPANIIVNPGGDFEIDPNPGSGILVRNLNAVTLTTGSAQFGQCGQMNIVAATNRSNRQLVFVAALSIAGSYNSWQGLVDLTNNDMDLPTGNLAVTANMIAQGYNAGMWSGAGGIISSTAAADPTLLTTLGIIQNNQSGSAIYTASNQFDGTTPGAGDILIKYTYYGDANLDGKVDGSDYSLIDNGYLSQRTADPLSGWFNGDFNYDGVIDGSDYTLIDNAFNLQGAQLTDAIGNPAAIVTAEIAGTARVPEPSTAGLLGISVIGLLNLRRRRAIQ
jgi:T5SS/PEP-CTERM-associated repeat protein